VAYPLILFLHGGGESGTDGKAPLRAYLGPAIKKREATFRSSSSFRSRRKGPGTQTLSVPIPKAPPQIDGLLDDDSWSAGLPTCFLFSPGWGSAGRFCSSSQASTPAGRRR
jgi:hypothetical protein